MSAPITQIYRSLIDQIRVGDRCVRFDITDEQAAQLIAGSEARAVQIAMLREYGNLCATNESLAKERDQLRDLLTEWKVSAHIKGEAIDSLLIECDRLYAEVERLTSVVLRKNGTIDGTEEMLGGLKQGEGYWDMVRRVVATAARAERAEAEVERLTKQAVFDGDHIHTLNAAFATRAEVMDAIARAERAEAELDQVACARTDGILRESDLECRLNMERARLDHIINSYPEGNPFRISRDKIDAAMKEGK